MPHIVRANFVVIGDATLCTSVQHANKRGAEIYSRTLPPATLARDEPLTTELAANIVDEAANVSIQPNRCLADRPAELVGHSSGPRTHVASARTSLLTRRQLADQLTSYVIGYWLTNFVQSVNMPARYSITMLAGQSAGQAIIQLRILPVNTLAR